MLLIKNLFCLNGHHLDVTSSSVRLKTSFVLHPCSFVKCPTQKDHDSILDLMSIQRKHRQETLLVHRGEFELLPLQVSKGQFHLSYLCIYPFWKFFPCFLWIPPFFNVFYLLNITWWPFCDYATCTGNFQMTTLMQTIMWRIIWWIN